MADVKPPSDNPDEPLIPMPSVTPPPAPSATPAVSSDPTPPKLAPEPPAPKVEKKVTPPALEPTSAPPTPPSPKDDTKASEPSGGLSDIKQKALQELKPLLDEVDLPADQKFHTILEIITATNDKELIPKLYEAAEGIEDKHERAQALIDVVSEIEYLTNPDSKK